MFYPDTFQNTPTPNFGVGEYPAVKVFGFIKNKRHPGNYAYPNASEKTLFWMLYGWRAFSTSCMNSPGRHGFLMIPAMPNCRNISI